MREEIKARVKEAMGVGIVSGPPAEDLVANGVNGNGLADDED